MCKRTISNRVDRAKWFERKRNNFAKTKRTGLLDKWKNKATWWNSTRTGGVDTALQKRFKRYGKKQLNWTLTDKTEYRDFCRLKYAGKKI